MSPLPAQVLSVSR